MSDDEEIGMGGMGGMGGDEGSDDMGDDDMEMPPPPADLPEGVQKEVLQEGDGWKRPKKGDEVEVHYVGTLQTDGSQFDSSRDRGTPLKFGLGKGQVIQGWDLGVATMKKGEKAKFTLQPEYAYGESGSPPKIPGNAVLVFEVELLSWTSKTDIFGDGGAIKALVQKGRSTSKHAVKDVEVCMSIKATAESGAVIEEKSNFDYVLGNGAFGEAGRVVDTALFGMNVNEKCSLQCAKDYVYKGADYGSVTIELHLHAVYTVSDVSLLKNKSVMKKTFVDADGYEKPADGSKVKVKVEAATDGERKPLPGFTGPTELSFELFSGEVCDALEGAVLGMKKGERALVTCRDPSKARETKLGLARVDADTVIFTLELLNFVKAKDVCVLEEDEKVALASDQKDVGAKLFAAKRFELALEKYKKVFEAIASHDNFTNEDMKKKAVEMKRAAELNKAACFLKLGLLKAAVESCDKVLEDERNNVKALFRRARAHFERSDLMPAAADVERVLELDPNNSEAKTLKLHVARAQKLEDKKSKATFAKMCQGLGKLGSETRTKAKEAPESEDHVGDDDEKAEGMAE